MDSPGMTAWQVLTEEDHPLDRLNRTELTVMQQLSVNASNREIAHRLLVSEQTVNNHVLHILDKLELASRREAARMARQNGLRAA